jgi:zinc transport system substrate-binding protein
VIATSDTILSGMASRLVPRGQFTVISILPPDQCPGHYDVKLSDVRTMDDAALALYFEDMPVGKHMAHAKTSQAALNTGGVNWMAPDNYIAGLDQVARALCNAFPQHAAAIEKNRTAYRREIDALSRRLRAELAAAGAPGAVAAASEMQRQNLEWMGLDVLCGYGRPESFSPRTVDNCVRQARERGAALVADNLQSGPDAGLGIAQSLGAPHVVLRNFPSDKGYPATLEENVRAIIKALE